MVSLRGGLRQVRYATRAVLQSVAEGTVEKPIGAGFYGHHLRVALLFSYTQTTLVDREQRRGVSPSRNRTRRCSGNPAQRSGAIGKSGDLPVGFRTAGRTDSEHLVFGKSVRSGASGHAPVYTNEWTQALRATVHSCPLVSTRPTRSAVEEGLTSPSRRRRPGP